jgi:coatomer subunit beta'
MKGSGSWSIEILHGGTLLGVRVMWVFFNPSFLVQSDSTFFRSRCLQSKVEEGAEITDEGVEEAFEVVAEVSEG